MFSETISILLALGVLIASVFGVRLYFKRLEEKVEADRIEAIQNARLLKAKIWETGMYSDVTMKNLRRASEGNAPSYFDYNNAE